MSAQDKAARRWKHVVPQPANTSRGELWRIEKGDRGAVWLRREFEWGTWERFEFPVPMVPLPSGPPIDEDSFNAPRLTGAFDLRQMYGPWVDLAVGACEPDVDNWEDCVTRPTLDQVRRVAFLTMFPLGWFYDPEPFHPIGWTSLDYHLPQPPQRRRSPQPPAADFV